MLRFVEFQDGSNKLTLTALKPWLLLNGSLTALKITLLAEIASITI